MILLEAIAINSILPIHLLGSEMQNTKRKSQPIDPEWWKTHTKVIEKLMWLLEATL